MCTKDEKRYFTAGWASVMGFLLIQFGTGIWWASSTTEQMAHFVTKETAARYQQKVEWNHNQLTEGDRYTQEEADADKRFQEYRHKALIDAITELKVAINEIKDHTHYPSP